jgi:hypothetical protein
MVFEKWSEQVKFLRFDSSKTLPLSGQYSVGNFCMSKGRSLGRGQTSNPNHGRKLRTWRKANPNHGKKLDSGCKASPRRSGKLEPGPSSSHNPAQSQSCCKAATRHRQGRPGLDGLRRSDAAMVGYEVWVRGGREAAAVFYSCVARNVLRFCKSLYHVGSHARKWHEMT